MQNTDTPKQLAGSGLPAADGSLPPEKYPHCASEKSFDTRRGCLFVCETRYFEPNVTEGEEEWCSRSKSCYEREIGRLREVLGMCESAMIGHVSPKHPAWKAIDAIKAENEPS